MQRRLEQHAGACSRGARTQSSEALAAWMRESCSYLSAPSTTPMTLSAHSTANVSSGGSSMNTGRSRTLRQ